jgi:1-acyl-sn-glycerol-3-phosphate acyltransferase
MSPWWILSNVFPGPLVNAVYRPIVKGFENVPASGAILASNHLSWSDPVFLQLSLRCQVIYPVNSRFYSIQGVHGWFIRRFLLACDTVKVEPASRSSGEIMVREARAALQHRRFFCIYPEGGIARDASLHRGRTGIGRVVADTGAPVVPVAMHNTDLVLPPVRRRPRIVRPVIHFGQVIDFSSSAFKLASELDVRAITDQIMRELELLSGRRYVDEYVKR